VRISDVELLDGRRSVGNCPVSESSIGPRAFDCLHGGDAGTHNKIVRVARCAAKP